MKTTLIVLALLAYQCTANPLASHAKAYQMRHFADLADKVNAEQRGWTATTDHELTYRVHHVFSQATCDHSNIKQMTAPLLSAQEDEEADKLPKNFDAREQWPECKSIGHIRDQSSCGSCWAFGSVEAMTDRICIASNGTKNPVLSAAHLTACSTEDNNCHGGALETAYAFYAEEGIVTGGDYNSSEGCWPYPYQPHPTEESDNIMCAEECPNKAYKQHKLTDDKHFGLDVKPLKTEKQIMLAIYKNGPVTGGFSVYDDFTTYRSGVYDPRPDGTMVGRHAIKILGWGEEEGKKYWLIANSWGPEWGNEGFVKMKKGTCELESMVVEGLPKLE